MQDIEVMKSLFFSAVLFAFSISVQAQSVEYSSVLTADQRTNSGQFTRLPGWQDLEIVKDGVINTALKQRWFRGEAISLERFHILQLREFDILTTGIQIAENRIEVPFAMGIRYQDRGQVARAYIQGTLNVLGRIVLTIEGRKITRISIYQYYDSNGIEVLGRKLGFLDEFDGTFASTVLESVLKNYFSEQGNFSALYSLVRQRLVLN